MPIKIIELEVSKPFEKLRRLEYQIYDIWALVRIYGYPLGWIRISNNQLPISAHVLTEIVVNTYAKNIYDYALRNKIVSGQGLSTGENLIASAFSIPPKPALSDYAPITALLWVSPHYNFKFVATCLEALRKQDHPNYEIIIGYNDIPPSDIAALAKNAGVSLIARPKAFQQVVLEAKGEFISITGEMAVPDKGWLRAIADLGKDPTASAITGPFLPLELENQAQLDFYFEAKRADWFADYFSFDEGYRYKAENLGTPLNASFRHSFLQEYCYHPMFDKDFDLRLMLHLYYIALSGNYKFGYACQAIVWERYPTDEKTLTEQLKQERAARAEIFVNALYRGNHQRKTLVQLLMANPESKSALAKIVVKKIRNKLKRTNASRS